MHVQGLQPVRKRTRFKPLKALASFALFALVFSGHAALTPPPPPQPAVAVPIPNGLDPLVRKYPAPTEAALTALKAGVDHYLAERYSPALEALPADGAEGASAVGDYVLLYKAKANLMLDRGEESLQFFRLLQSRYPNSPLVCDAVLGEGQALLKLRQPQAALAALQKSALADDPEILFYRGRAFEDAGDRANAASIYLRIISESVASRLALPAAQQLATLSPGYLTRPGNYEILIKRAENLIGAGKSRDAGSLLQKLARVRAPDAAAAARRALLFAQAEYNLGKATTVLPQLKKIGATQPDLHAHSIYLQGACYRRLDKEASFLAARDTALRLYPKSPFTEKLLYSVASYYDVNQRLEQAQDAYAAVAARFPKGEHARQSRWRGNLLLYAQHCYEQALRGFWEYLLSYRDPFSSRATTFWLGRCYEKLGDGAAAAHLYSRCRLLSGNSYYGQISLESGQDLKQAGRGQGTSHAGIDFEQVRRVVDAFSLPQASIPEPSPVTAPVIERARQLATAALADLAIEELRRALRLHPDDAALRYVKARAHELKEDYHGAIVTMRQAYPDYVALPMDSLPREVWNLLYPFPYQDIARSHAAKNNVDPHLVLGIIRQESAFETGARSRADARGLMQLLPSTGRSLARQAGIPRFTTTKLYQPDVNIALGTRYFATLLQRFDSRVELALAAYNAGSRRVSGWMEDIGDVEMAEFVERIPFSETRNYIKQVLSNAACYRALQFEPAPKTQ